MLVRYGAHRRSARETVGDQTVAFVLQPDVRFTNARLVASAGTTTSLAVRIMESMRLEDGRRPPTPRSGTLRVTYLRR